LLTRWLYETGKNVVVHWRTSPDRCKYQIIWPAGFDRRVLTHSSTRAEFSGTKVLQGDKETESFLIPAADDSASPKGNEIQEPSPRSSPSYFPQNALHDCVEVSFNLTKGVLNRLSIERLLQIRWNNFLRNVVEVALLSNVSNVRYSYLV
jgi:hypothetical protein